jgi:hypothetical protein
VVAFVEFALIHPFIRGETDFVREVQALFKTLKIPGDGIARDFAVE